MGRGIRYMDLKQRYVFEMVRIEKGMKLMGMTTRNEYKVVNGESQSASPDSALCSNLKGCNTTRKTCMHQS